MKAAFIIFCIACPIVFVITFFTGSEYLTMPMRIGGSVGIAAIFSIGVVFGGDSFSSSGRHNRSRNMFGGEEKMISCRKCGYLGAGSGSYCPKCGWNVATEIKEDTHIVSCPKCGFLGAGVGSLYPKCGWNVARRVR